MTWKSSVSPAEAVDLLNDLMRLDPIAVRRLFSQRAPCTVGVAQHPTVQVGEEVSSGGTPYYSLGFLGVLNGLFGTDPGGRGVIWEVHGLASGLQKFTLAPEHMSAPSEPESREQLLARLEAAEAKAAVVGGEACIENRRAGRGPCGACAVCCADLRKELEEARTAQRDIISKLEAKTVLGSTSPSPAQRAKMEGDGKAEFLDVWLRELGEDREWLGSAGGPAFGPERVRTEPTGMPQATARAPHEVFVRMAAGARRRRVCVVSHFRNGLEVLGFFNDTQFIPLSLCIVEDITPYGFQEADLGELQVGQQVVVRDDDNGEPMWVTVAAGQRSPGSYCMCLGYYQSTGEGERKFVPFTKETYVKKTYVKKTRGAT